MSESTETDGKVKIAFNLFIGHQLITLVCKKNGTCAKKMSPSKKVTHII